MRKLSVWCCLERVAALQAGDEEPAGGQGQNKNKHTLDVLLKFQVEVLSVQPAGSSAAEAVLSGSFHSADEAGAAPSQHDEGRAQQPERTFI